MAWICISSGARRARCGCGLLDAAAAPLSCSTFAIYPKILMMEKKIHLLGDAIMAIFTLLS